MNYPPDFISELKTRAAGRCECERSECHSIPERCPEPLIEDDNGQRRWSPVPTGEGVTYPPAASNYIALCLPCVKPRVPPM